ncbi:hypothetical protein Ahia01_000673700 [Argonauta hians]
MPTSCAAYKCTNRNDSRSREQGITFHCFPKELKRRKEWSVALKYQMNGKIWVPEHKTYLCSQHFSEECFDRTGQTTRLRYGSVPSIFNFPLHMKKTISASGQRRHEKYKLKVAEKTGILAAPKSQNLVASAANPVESCINSNGREGVNSNADVAQLLHKDITTGKTACDSNNNNSTLTTSSPSTPSQISPDAALTSQSCQGGKSSETEVHLEQMNASSLNAEEDSSNKHGNVSNRLQNGAGAVGECDRLKRVYIVRSHPRNMLHHLALLWRNGKFCDAGIGNKNATVMVHKIVLLAMCPKLLSMPNADLSSSQFLRVNFPKGVSQHALDAFADYMYNGILDIDSAILNQLRTIAVCLEMQELKFLCDTHLSHLQSSAEVRPSSQLDMSIQSGSTEIHSFSTPNDAEKIPKTSSSSSFSSSSSSLSCSLNTLTTDPLSSVTVIDVRDGVTTGTPITSNPHSGLASTPIASNPHSGVVGTPIASNLYSGLASTPITSNPHSGLASTPIASNPHSGLASTPITSNPHSGLASTPITSNPHSSLASTPIASNPHMGISDTPIASSPHGDITIPSLASNPYSGVADTPIASSTRSEDTSTQIVSNPHMEVSETLIASNPYGGVADTSIVSNPHGDISVPSVASNPHSEVTIIPLTSIPSLHPNYLDTAAAAAAAETPLVSNPQRQSEPMDCTASVTVVASNPHVDQDHIHGSAACPLVSNPYVQSDHMDNTVATLVSPPEAPDTVKAGPVSGLEPVVDIIESTESLHVAITGAVTQDSGVTVTDLGVVINNLDLPISHLCVPVTNFDLAVSHTGVSDPTVSQSSVPNDPDLSVSHPNNPDLSLSHPNDPDLSVSHPNDPDLSVSHANDPDLAVSHLNDPDLAVSHPNDPDLSVSHPNDPDLAVSHPNDPDLAVLHPNDPVLAVSHPNNPDLSVSHPNDPDLSVSHPNGPDLAVSHPNNPDLSVSHPCDSDLAVSHPNDPDLSVSHPCDSDLSVSHSNDPDLDVPITLPAVIEPND